MRKNEIVTVTIEDMGVNGEGIGRADGYTLFVKDAVIGDQVEVKVTKEKKNYGYARLMKILTPSEYRVEPKCPHARRCGGCQIQEMAYPRQLAFKQDKVRGNLERIGEIPEELLDAVMEPILGMGPQHEIGKGGGLSVERKGGIGIEAPYHYRNKAQFPIGTDKEGNIVAGFYAGRTHTIIPNLDCPLGVRVNEKILSAVLAHMKTYRISAYDEEKHTGLVRHVLIRCGFRTGEIMACIVINGDALPHGEELAETLAEIPGMTSITLCVNKEKTNVIMGDTMKLLRGQTYITDYIGEVKYQISPLSFYQVNPVQTEKLYGLVMEYSGLGETDQKSAVVWDLYCGIGTISLFLAQRAKQVYGVEIVPQAVEDARRNAQINGIANAEFFVGKAEEVLPEQYKNYGDKVRADVIVVDPPRKGCDESLLRTMAEMQPERIVYVSCDPATLARDVKYLRGQGYELRRARPVDMFPHTGHVETVVGLQRKDT